MEPGVDSAVVLLTGSRFENVIFALLRGHTHKIMLEDKRWLDIEYVPVLVFKRPLIQTKYPLLGQAPSPTQGILPLPLEI